MLLIHTQINLIHTQIKTKSCKKMLLTPQRIWITFFSWTNSPVLSIFVSSYLNTIESDMPRFILCKDKQSTFTEQTIKCHIDKAKYQTNKLPSVTAHSRSNLKRVAAYSIGFLFICVTLFLCFCKFLLVAKHEGVNLEIKINRQQLVSNSGSIFNHIIELGHVGVKWKFPTLLCFNITKKSKKTNGFKTCIG